MFITPYRQKRETDTRFVPATVDDKAFVNLEYRETLDELTGWQKRAWRFGDWDIAAGQFFTTWRETVHVTAGVRGQESGNSRYRRFWGALDYGFTHYTAAYLSRGGWGRAAVGAGGACGAALAAGPACGGRSGA